MEYTSYNCVNLSRYHFIKIKQTSLKMLLQGVFLNRGKELFAYVKIISYTGWS